MGIPVFRPASSCLAAGALVCLITVAALGQLDKGPPQAFVRGKVLLASLRRRKLKLSWCVQARFGLKARPTRRAVSGSNGAPPGSWKPPAYPTGPRPYHTSVTQLAT